VTLYQGGQYFLYTYRRYDDVRLVFAPEAAMAQFGGDPDNFNFPRYDLDMGLVRAYEGGRPVHPADFLRFDPAGAKAGEMTRIAFANPHNLDRDDGKSTVGKSRDRKNLSIKLSYDEGQTWPVNKTLEPSWSGYSDLAVLPNGTILCFYERGSSDGKSSTRTTHLTVARFNLDWLTDGKDSF